MGNDTSCHKPVINTGFHDLSILVYNMSDDKNNPTTPGIDLGDLFGNEGDELEHVEVSSGGTDQHPQDIEVPDQLAILPIRDTCVFPGTVVPLTIVREKSKRVLDMALAGTRLIAIVAQRSAETDDPQLDDLYRIGTACSILKMLKMTDGSETIIVHGLRRIGIEQVTAKDNYLEATVHTYEDTEEVTMEHQALAHSIRTAAEQIIELSPTIPDEAREVLNGIERPGALADFMAANLPLSLIHKQEILETFGIIERLRKVNLSVATQLEVVKLSDKIQQKVKGQVDQSQRDYYLREQLKAIQQELGEDDAKSVALDQLRERIEAAKMPEQAQTEATRELERLAHIPQASPEYSMALDYVEWLAEMPWSIRTKDRLDIKRAQRILDRDHYGLEQVKQRIIEFLAVRTLKQDSRGPILCFTGPPGVGKTSLGQSIAHALGRKFIRMSLGGIRDEATIRGHRRTYVGAMPGRIMREIRRAESLNPLFMLDEIDKIGQDLRGDPMSALLEVLDPAQNTAFSDHYLGVPFDLSHVMFITTANYMYAIEPALRDRMEIIEIDGYTQREKIKIAEHHLIPRQLEQNGLSPELLHFDADVLAVIVSDYTREAGVRELERKIGAVCRARATAMVRGKKRAPKITVAQLRTILGNREYESEVAAATPMPGVVTGLAFTAVGGEILFIEAAAVPGNGQLKLTGQLGDVMRESAIAASTIIQSRLGRASQNESVTDAQSDFHQLDIHVHVPAGATPKDGPSAGVAMLAAMASALTGECVDPETGMTGEITLSGRVLPVGGIRQKVLAAFRAGLKRIIMPARNKQDLDEVPEDVRKQIDFVFVKTIDQLLNTVFGSEKSPPVKRKAAKRKTKKRKAAKRKTAKRKTAKPPTNKRKS